MGYGVQVSWPDSSSFAPQAVLGQLQQAVEFAESQLCIGSEAMPQHQERPAKGGPISYFQSYYVLSSSCSYPLNGIKQKQ